MPSKYNPEHETVLNNMMKGQSAAEPGRMFGYPAYKVNGKMAARLHEDGIIIKVGQKRAEEVISKGNGQKFESLPGRVWKDWVLLTGDFDKNKALFKEAVENVKKETA